MTPESTKATSYGAEDPTGNERLYFDREDRILSDPTHPGYIMPVFVRGESVLNLGCGRMRLHPPNGELYVGIDPFFEPLQQRKQDDPNDLSIRAIGEVLPLRDASFGLIMARGSIMYMDVPSFLPEAYRVLEPGGRVWLTGHKFSHVALHFLVSLFRLNVKDVIFRTYVFTNGLLFHYLGLMTRFPLNRGRIESFQTKGGLRRALARQGFTDIEFVVPAPNTRGFRRGLRRIRRLLRSARLRRTASQLLEWRHFLVTARKPSSAGRPQG